MCSMKGITAMIEEIFEKQTKVTLKELYESFSQKPGIDLSESTLKHRIRSALYGLKQRKVIQRISDGTYMKI